MKRTAIDLVPRNQEEEPPSSFVKGEAMYYHIQLKKKKSKRGEWEEREPIQFKLSTVIRRPFLSAKGKFMKTTAAIIKRERLPLTKKEKAIIPVCSFS